LHQNTKKKTAQPAQPAKPVKPAPMLWLRIIRPQTLFASLCPVLVGLIIVPQCSHLVTAATILCALSLQILSNLINDLYDFLRGTDQAARIGFRRALAEGEVSLSQMRLAVLLTLFIAVLLGVYLVWIGGWPILLIGLTALLFAWLYTATSHSLSYLGIADIFVYLYFGILASMGTVWLQLPFSSDVYPLLRQAFFGGSVCGLISMCVLMINNLRDLPTDAPSGKRTLPVRFGKRVGELLLFVYALLSPIFAWFAWHAWLPCLIVVPMLLLAYAVHRAKGTQYNRCLLLTGLLNLLYVLLTFWSI